MTDTRTYETTIEIAVPAEAVWQAITSAEQLVNWFPTRADITPGAGGEWRISWDGNWPWNTTIEIWEPARRLRLLDRAARPYDVDGAAANASVSPLPIAIDWFLEGRGGSTSLRLVHAGFGRGGAWDDEFEGVSTGWPLELHGLKHYLEQHHGQQRRVAWNRVAVPVAPAAIWSRVIGRDGIVPDARLFSLNPGDRYDVTLATGDHFSGTVVLRIPDRALQVTVDGLNHALYRLWVDRVGSESAVNSWLSAYGVPERAVREFDARMRAEIHRLAAALAPA